MFLSIGPAPEFLKFIQILSWIILPILVASVLVTLFIHYRKKKTGSKKIKKSEDEFIQATPEQVGYTKGDGEYVLFDHSQLIQEYKDRLTSSHARFKALQHDYTTMEAKYTNLAMYIQTMVVTNKKESMKISQEQMPKHIQKEIDNLGKEHGREIKDLLDRIEQLGASYHTLEQENKSLLEQIRMGTATDAEKMVIINRWKEENAVLRDKVAEQDYVKDILEEKKTQIVFLQQQLEQRIKDHHRTDQLHTQLAAEISQMKENSHFIYQQTEVLKSELQLKQDQADKMQCVLCEKEEQLMEKEQMLGSKQNHIIYLENLLREARDQNERLHASVADIRDQVAVVQQQISDEQSKVQFLEQKLMTNKQTMRRLFREVSAGMEEEKSPVIALRANYGTENEDMTGQ